MTEFKLPKMEALSASPPDNNPFNHDHFNMGVEVSGAWMVMTDQHAGIKTDYNCSPEERLRKDDGESVFYDDPSFLTFVNIKTGQRFKLIFDNS